MAPTTLVCPSCASDVLPGQTRCNTCAQVLGEDNRCEHCQALTPAVEHNGKLTCHACGSARSRRPGTVVVAPGQLERAVGRARLTQQVSAGLAWIIALVGLGAAAILGLFGQNAVERSAGLIIAAFVAAIVYGFARLARSARVRQDARVRADLEQRLMGLAAQRKGAFSAEDAARHLGISAADANRLLEGLVRTQQADMEVSERGDIQFVLESSRRAGGVRLAEVAQLPGSARRAAQASSH